VDRVGLENCFLPLLFGLVVLIWSMVDAEVMVDGGLGLDSAYVPRDGLDALQHDLQHPVPWGFESRRTVVWVPLPSLSFSTSTLTREVSLPTSQSPNLPSPSGCRNGHRYRSHDRSYPPSSIVRFFPTTTSTQLVHHYHRYTPPLHPCIIPNESTSFSEP
jgi:hypothetical protein